MLDKTVRFDVFSHHPYSVGGPRQPAISRNDVALPDVHRLVKLVRVANRRGRSLPRRPKRFWVTEVSWDSRPPDPQGVPAKRHARWVAVAATIQSGILFEERTDEASVESLRIPVQLRAVGVAEARLGQAPSSEPVSILEGSGRVVEVLRPDSDKIVYTRVDASGPLRAQCRDRISITCAN